MGEAIGENRETDRAKEEQLELMTALCEENEETQYCGVYCSHSTKWMYLDIPQRPLQAKLW